MTAVTNDKNRQELIDRAITGYRFDKGLVRLTDAVYTLGSIALGTAAGLGAETLFPTSPQAWVLGVAVTAIGAIASRIHRNNQLDELDSKIMQLQIAKHAGTKPQIPQLDFASLAG